MSNQSGDRGGPPSLEEVLANKWDVTKMSALAREASSSRGRALDHATRSRFEGRLGADFGNVRIITGDLAEAITKAHGAEALTIGDTGMVLMRESASFAPGSAAGTALLAHELTHVAQARPGLQFKAPYATLAQEEESEAEAEAHEMAVLAEESDPGGASAGAVSSGKVKKQREDEEEKRKKVVELVVGMLEDDIRSLVERAGSRRIPQF